VSPIMKLFLKPMMRSVIIGPKAYKRNAPTAPYFKAVDVHDFELEKQRLLNNVSQYSTGGKEKAECINHAWLGKLRSTEWSWAMYKHLDHHLKQFGV